MKRKKKRVFQLLLCVALMLTMLIPTVTSIRAESYKEGVDDEGLDPLYTWYSGHPVAYNQASQSIIFQTLNVTKTSTTYYHTLGYEFSRTVAGTSDKLYDANGDREYVFFSIRELEEIEYHKTDGTTIATYVLTLDRLLEKIRLRDIGWYEEVMDAMNNEGMCYVGVDAVIEMVYNNQHTAIITSNTDGTYICDWLTSNPSRQILYRWNNYESMYPIFGNRDSVCRGIDDHFKKFLNIGSYVEEDNEDNTGPSYIADPTISMVIKKDYADTNNTTSASGDGYSAPTTYAYNKCDMFDLADGIPASESYTNGIDVSPWYGSVGISKITQYYEVPVQYTIDVNYPVVSYSTWGPTNANMTGWTHTTGNVTSVCTNGTLTSKGWVGQTVTTTIHTLRFHGTYTYVFSNYYYGINSLKLYELEKAVVFNDSVGATEYVVDPNIQYNVTISKRNINSNAGTYFDASTYETHWDVTEDPHVTLPTITAEDRVYNETLEYSYAPSSEEIRAYVEAQVGLRFSNRKLATINDTLELNNRRYMDANNIYFDFSAGSQMSIGTESNDHVIREKVVTIPEDEANGIYYTSIETTYHSMGALRSKRTLKVMDDAVDTSYPAIRPDFKHNEPVVVHSPVIAPISISGELQTQTQQASSVGAQLILDNNYTVDFVWNRYFMMKGYDMPAGWTKYIKDKLVRFPFAVEVNGEYYDVITDDILAQEAGTNAGYTEWISVGAVESFDFYLPTWAKEGVYGSTGVNDNTLYNYSSLPIQIKCLANNYIAGTPQIGEEYEWNSQLNNYSATYDYPVQVSGVMYDFAVLATTDEIIFGLTDGVEMGCWQFFDHNEDRRVGEFNRFGNEFIRYYWTGLVEDDWQPINTLPFACGKSPYASEAGYLKKGSAISFSFKTIADLEGTDDYIKIIPHYRYIDSSGNVYEEDEFNLYYHDGAQFFIQMGSDRDTACTKDVVLGSKWFEVDRYEFRDYNNDDVQFTADADNRTFNEVVWHKTPSFNMADITLYSTQRLLTGTEEELEINEENDGSTVIRYNTAGGLGRISGDSTTDFKKSMQTWYGKYNIPDSLFVSLKDDSLEGEDMYQQMMFVEGGPVTETSECWEEGGFLVLNFEIISYIDGHEHLHYYNPTGSPAWLNMWTREQGPNPLTEVLGTSGRQREMIDLRVGDVAIINMSRSISDDYYVGILYIN